MDDCERAMDEFASPSSDEELPPIITEDWCVDHLIDEGVLPEDLRP